MHDPWADLRDIIHHVSELETELKQLVSKVSRVRRDIEDKRNTLLENWLGAKDTAEQPHFGQMA
jgi:hypothetical protein